MTTNNALNRIRWRFGAEKDKPSFRIFQKDVDAINCISEYIDQTQKQIANHNQLFAKLYVYMVMKIMEQKRSSVFDNIARKQIGNILKLPLSQLIEMLTDSMNHSDLYQTLKDSGVIMKHPAIRSEDENEKNKEALREVGVIEMPWKFEDVEEAIISEINLMIELHG